VIRVLHVLTRLSLGGSSENTLATMVALRAAGYDGPLAVSLPASEAPVVESARRRGCRLLDVPGLGREVAPLRDLGALRALLRIVADERPQIVHTHTSKAGFLGRLAARLRRVPAVIHQPHGHVFYGYWGPWRSAAFARLERLAAAWTDRLVALTPREVEEHVARGIGTPAQWVVVPSGVPLAEVRGAAPSRAAARQRLGLAADRLVVAGVGRLVPVKGFDLLVEALPRLAAEAPGALVLLVGDGPERPALEARAAALGVGDRLRITGATAEVPLHLAAADLLAAPSRNEGMGRVLVEAMALGLPVVGARVGGIPDVVAEGESGRLVPPEDAPALGEALLALARDPALRARLGAAGARRAEAFSSEVAARGMGALYDDLARAKGLR
jgi:glycosyltransferase involved in cell wall biosynthesis